MDIQGQIEHLQKQAAELKARDFDKTVQEIRAKMLVFGITVKDIQTVKRGPKSTKVKGEMSPKKAAGTGAKKATSKTTVAAKFRGPNGETWSGRGLSPRWLTTLVEQGAKREDFAITA
jgi:DNA-binding protein H-NS